MDFDFEAPGASSSLFAPPDPTSYRTVEVMDTWEASSDLKSS